MASSVGLPRQPTSADVARLAGVSRATVSYVLNDAPNENISEATRARVRAAAARIGYQPHAGAQSLRSSVTHILGLLVPEANNGHHQETAAGVEACARRKGYSLFQSVTNFDAAEDRRGFLQLKQRRFDALILTSALGATVLNEMGSLLERGAVITGLGFSDPRIDAVRTEPIRGERQVLEHLVALGHRRIGYIYGVADQEVFRSRLDTCLELQGQLKVPFHEAWVRRCGPTLADGYQATQELLQLTQGEERPTALIVVNDLVAMAVLAALHAAGIAVPAEMSVISFDNTSMAEYTVPSLTSVDCEARLMGEHAASLTIARLEDRQRPLTHIETRAELVVRGSTGPAPR